MRRIVVLPEPDGPSSATSSPLSMSSETPCTARNVSKVLTTCVEADLHGLLLLQYVLGGAASAGLRPSGALAFEQHLGDDGDDGEHRKDGGGGKSAGRLVIVVEQFDMERQRVGLAANIAGDDRHRAELAHDAGVAEHHAVKQRPSHIGQCHREEGPPAGRAKRGRGLLEIAALRLHQRDELARHEGCRDEHRGKHDARQGEQDLDIRQPPAPGRTRLAGRRRRDRRRRQRSARPRMGSR